MPISCSRSTARLAGRCSVSPCQVSLISDVSGLITQWWIRGSFLIYVPPKESAERDKLVFVDLEKENATLKLKNFIPDPSCNQPVNSC